MVIEFRKASGSIAARRLPTILRNFVCRWRAASCAVIAVHALLLAYGATRTAPTYDETGHMVAGLSHHEFGRMDLYNVNPPLVRLIATFPVWIASPKMDWENWGRYGRGRQEVALGRQFIAANGVLSIKYFIIARWACIPMSILGAMVCHRWATELYGEAAGLVTLCLWCFSPNILGHAQLMTPDVAAASMGILAIYCFRHWLYRPCLSTATVAGVCHGLAIGTKTTWILLFALYPVIWSVYVYRLGTYERQTTSSESRHPPRLLSSSLQLTLIFGISLFTINSLYAFEGSFRSLGSYTFYSQLLSGETANGSAIRSPNRFSGTLLGELPMPFPKDMVVGIDVQKSGFDRNSPAYLAGIWQNGGWWYYYLYAMGVKMPVGTLLLLAISGLTFLQKRAVADEWLLLLMASVVIFTVSSQIGINKHLRYLFPAFPMLFILASRGVMMLTWRWLKALAPACTAATVTASLSVYPYSLSFFNSPAGGPANGAEHLLNSNISWGQDILELIEWAKTRPDNRPLYCALLASYDPKHLGLNYHIPPQRIAQRAYRAQTDPPPGWYAIDVNFLHGDSFPIPDGNGGFTAPDPQFWTQFRDRVPQGKIGYSIYIYVIPTRTTANGPPHRTEMENTSGSRIGRMFPAVPGERR